MDYYDYMAIQDKTAAIEAARLQDLLPGSKLNLSNEFSIVDHKVVYKDLHISIGCEVNHDAAYAMYMPYFTVVIELLGGILEMHSFKYRNEVVEFVS